MPIRQTGDRAEPVVRLFCFPYSGAAATVFGTWSRTLPAFIQVQAVELPGRGRRLREAPARRLADLVDDIAAGFQDSEAPFAFFGHSMGALLAFELARRLESEAQSGPVHLFVSGHSAPDVERTADPIHQLPGPEFMERIRDLQGTPEELLANHEFRDMLLPILRADFQVCETYEYSPRKPLACGISVLGGLGDPYVGLEDLEAWRRQTSGPFSVRMFPGNHFFLNSAMPSLFQAIARDLVQVLGTRG
jgi:medium-chain acyl-[acyl-carrier-protein] hydrolase